MNLYEIRKLLYEGRSIYDLKLRVVYYARVSTDKYDQLNSLNNQVSYYEELIHNNSNWEFIGGYIDEGISGTTLKKRVNFNKMINDAKNNRFDLIITKEISRFARDTLTSIKYTRELLEHSVGVYFQNDNILTFDSESELRLTIMSSIAQEEVRKLSERVKFGFKRQIEKGSVLGNDCIWGYIKDRHAKDVSNKCGLIIVPEEAKIVKLIYDLYVNHNMGMRLIGKHLASLGYLSKTGKPFAQSTIKSILTNPKYKGYYCGNKTKVIDYHTKKRINIDKEEWKLYKDKDIPKIIDEVVWNKAQEIINKRSSKSSSDKRIYQNRYVFSGKIICLKHSKCYRRKKQVSSGIKRKTIITWRCSEFLQYNKDKCNSPILYEEELLRMVNRLILDNISFDKVIFDLMEEYKHIDTDTNYKRNLINKEKEINKLNVYKNNLYNLLKDNTLDIKTFKDKINEVDLQLNVLITETNKLKDIIGNKSYKDNKLSYLKDVIVSKTNQDGINKEQLIKVFLTNIEVYEENDNYFKLDIYFNIGKSTSVYYDNKKHHFCSNDTYDESRC